MTQQTSPTGQTVLTEQSSFQFACKDTLPCFTQCCRDVNIYLTPYDMLRLRRALRLSSGAILNRYTRHFLSRSGIPVVQLAMDPQTLTCQFVTPEGCSLYDDRPWACRMYPLDLGNREGEYQFIVGKDRCLGLMEPTALTVAAWLESQGVTPYVEMERAYQAVLPPGFKPGSNVGSSLGKLLFLAYDLDRFSEILNDKKFLSFYDVDEELLRQAREDDEALLRLALLYVKEQIEELRNLF